MLGLCITSVCHSPLCTLLERGGGQSALLAPASGPCYQLEISPAGHSSTTRRQLDCARKKMDKRERPRLSRVAEREHRRTSANQWEGSPDLANPSFAFIHFLSRLMFLSRSAFLIQYKIQFSPFDHFSYLWSAFQELIGKFVNSTN